MTIKINLYGFIVRSAEAKQEQKCMKIYDVKGESHSLSQYIIAATAHLWQMMDAVMGKEDNVSLQTAVMSQRS